YQEKGFSATEAWLAEVLALVFDVQQAGEVVGDVIAAKVDASVEPGLGAHRRGLRLGGGVGFQGIGASKGRKLLRVPLLDHAKAAELALFAVEVAVMVGVASHEAIPTDMIVGRDLLNHVHGKRQSRDPGFAVALV